jgi:hypothetical protein
MDKTELRNVGKVAKFQKKLDTRLKKNKNMKEYEIGYINGAALNSDRYTKGYESKRFMKGFADGTKARFKYDRKNKETK